MPANKFTMKAVDAILEADLGVSTCVRTAVAKLIGRDPDTSCGETEAARILEISDSTLYNWRKGRWTKQPHPFFFHTWQTPAGEARYDIDQLRAYAALRRTRSTPANPQPEITAEETARFQEFIIDQR